MNKKILSAIPLNGTTYTAGMEDDLEKVLSSEQVKYLTEQGALEGFGSGKKQEPETEKSLSKMNKAELVAEAERVGVKVVPDEMTNKQIIEAIENK